ncbi:MAG: glycosyltransferase family 2 protein [Chloroflexi bacterium]|nr:glycosyltransferase family 2 protein [Chloroflexota bacterium]
MNPLLSVIIPTYNEEKRIPATLERIIAYLLGQDYGAEIIVVDDGSNDRTCPLVASLETSNPPITLIQTPHMGKGHAIKTGMLAARGQYRLMCDADLSVPIEEVAHFLPPNLSDYDVAIGSREMTGARRFDEPFYRHLMGRVFNWLVRLVTVRGFKDTQCGFKVFSQETAKSIFAKTRMAGWAFDVEVLFLAQKRGLHILEIPVPWYHGKKSKVSPFRDTFLMFGEILLIRLNHWLGRYPKD